MCNYHIFTSSISVPYNVYTCVVVYESNAIRSANIPRETISNLEKPTDRREDRYNHNVRNECTTRPFVPGHRPMEAPAPHHTTTMPNVEQPKLKFDHRVGLEEDPHAPTNSPANILPSNYQSKVSDTTGAGNVLSSYFLVYACIFVCKSVLTS